MSGGVAMEAVRLSFHSRRVDSVFHHEGAAILASLFQHCSTLLLQGVASISSAISMPCRLLWMSISLLTARRLDLHQSCGFLHVVTSRAESRDFEFSPRCLTVREHAELPKPVPQVKGASRIRAARWTASTQISVDRYMCL